MNEPVFEFSCRVCGVQCEIAPGLPVQAVCPQHCENHEYINAGMTWPTCAHCGQYDPAVAAAPEKDEWQPIATVPKQIDVLVIGGFIDLENSRHANKCDQATKVWTTDRIVFSVADTYQYSAIVRQPTHWMPLPLPPKVTK